MENTSTDNRLFIEKESSGIIIMLTIKLVFLFGFLLSQIIIGHTVYEQVISGILVFIFVPIYIFSYKSLKKFKYIKQIGYMSLFFDIILLFSQPMVWYSSMSQHDVSHAILFKSHAPILTLAFIVINSFTLNPKYPGIITGFGSILLSAIIIAGIRDPRTVYTNEYIEYYTGNVTFLTDFLSVSILVIAAGTMVTFSAAIARKTVIRGIEHERKSQNLGRYFSPSLIDHIADAKSEFLKPGGRSSEAVIMFTDIRNFTSFSEKNSPDQVIDFLTDYHKLMVKAIFKYNGTIDKFLGDGILAVFGNPAPSEDDSENAVKAAIEMQQQLKDLNMKRAKQNLPTLSQGIGIHRGNVIIGNVGTEEKLEYTVIGDTVNIASRIESQCRQLEEKILISESVKDKLHSEYEFKKYRNIHLKGKDVSFNLYGIQ